jgi:prolyl-tRNA synthetase
MVILDPEDVEVMQSAEIVYRELELRGIKALMDDRSVDTSEKFNEAERLALPVQVNIGAIGLHAGEVEVISRRVKEKRKVQLEDAVDLASELLRS